jgi:uncharacterized membrane protein
LKHNPNQNNGIGWLKFAGLASQWAIALVALMFLGKYFDHQHWVPIKMPIFIWVLPFVFIIFSLVNLIKETNSKSSKK